MSAVWVIDPMKLRAWGARFAWFSLNDIAHGLDVAPSTVSRVINGQSIPGHQLLASIRLVMGEEAFGDICTVTRSATALQERTGRKRNYGDAGSYALRGVPVRDVTPKPASTSHTSGH